MNAQMARFKIKTDTIPQFEEALKNVFKALERERPKGVVYTVYRLPDGDAYFGLLELENGSANPLPELPEGKKFLQSLQNWAVEPPNRDLIAVVGCYRSCCGLQTATPDSLLDQPQPHAE